MVFEYYKNHKTKDALQTINSVTKTVLSTLYGIAIHQGIISDLDEMIHVYYPNDQDCFDQPDKLHFTIRHLLTMSEGFDWPEWGDWH